MLGNLRCFSFETRKLLVVLFLEWMYMRDFHEDFVILEAILMAIMLVGWDLLIRKTHNSGFIEMFSELLHFSVENG